MTDWRTEREQKRLQRKQAQIARAMAAPVSRAEVYSDMTDTLMKVASIGVGLEALEQLLIERGILKDDELMDRCAVVARAHAEQAEAAAATAPDPPRIITDAI